MKGIIKRISHRHDCAGCGEKIVYVAVVVMDGDSVVFYHIKCFETIDITERENEQ